MSGFNLKDKEEVKLYLENLGTEYRFGCYHEKRPEVCHLLGDFFEAINKEYEKASKIYRVNCDDLNHGHSCHKYGSYLMLGKGNLTPDMKKAATYYDKGCSLKYAESCLHSGLLRINKESQELKDDKLAHKRFEDGCNLNNNMSCFYLSGMFISGIPGYVEKDMTKAFEYTNKACELGNVYACANLSQMYKRGEGISKDETKAEEFKRKALDIQDQFTKPQPELVFGEGL